MRAPILRVALADCTLVATPELTMGIGTDAVLECTGTHESMIQGIRSTRPGGSIGSVAVPHGVELDGAQLFSAQVHPHGGPAPVRRYST